MAAIVDDGGTRMSDGAGRFAEGGDFCFQELKGLGEDLARIEFCAEIRLLWIHESLGREEIGIDETREKHPLEECEREAIVRRI